MSKKLKPSEEYAPIFNRLIKLCEMRETSVSQLLDVFASSRSAVGAWKNGNINANLIEGIAKHLNVSVEYLITGKENRPVIQQKRDIQQINGREKELLEYFRELSDEEQIKLIGRAEVLAEQAKLKENVG
ncbi:MAG: hypothetical protein K2J40_05345 [Ruminococcus sp.]|nr:hypothetical protein [Ruminococcus sp.]